mmetsp:Transcript_37810/g.43444  ORF Transcript_37810/g.43444 Transcript_37810/m.43444 type:complete len:163 (-) Transcript_37810:426-914(-)
MELINKIFFPKEDHSSDNEQKVEDLEDDRDDDLYEEGSRSFQRIDLFNNLGINSNVFVNPTSMTEREVREIMHQYNGSIDSFTREIVELKAKIKDLDDDILKVKKQSILLDDKNRSMRHKMHNSIANKEKIRLKIIETENNIDLIHESKVSGSDPVKIALLK